ncbi:MAG: endonuclease/exonuclease/phosphatase family protein [Nocardioidaceae bacterium]
MASTYYVAWWNVENLFDEEASPRRTEKLTRALGESILGWTPELRDRKMEQLASVIVQMNAGRGPDLMGICEVENEFVVHRLKDVIKAKLPDRAYDLAHADTVDERGIDVAFLFDTALFTAPPNERFQHVVMRRTATREILQVNLHTHHNRTWVVFGNHWPSRSGGQLESAGYRAIAGETLAFFHERVLEIHGATTPVLVTGDFNDEPFDLSLVQYAMSTRQRAKVLSATSPRLWNLMWETLGTGDGSFYFDNHANLLDQFLVNKNMCTLTSAIQAVPDSVELVRFPGMANTGTFPTPVPFGGMGKPVNTDGFADHFPIAMTVVETD